MSLSSIFCFASHNCLKARIKHPCNLVNAFPLSALQPHQGRIIERADAEQYQSYIP